MDRREFNRIALATSLIGALPRAVYASPSDGWEQDAVWIKANSRNSHRFTVRHRLPSSAGDWPRTMTTTVQMQTEMGSVRHQDLERTVFYGNSLDSFHGFSAYFNTINPDNAQNAANVIDGDSKSLRRSSLWLVIWDGHAIHMITPDGKRPHGFGRTTSGLVVKDWRYVVRVANVDIADVLNRRWYGRMLFERALYKLPTIKKSQTYLYTSENMAKVLRLNRVNTRGIPVRGIAALRDDEAQVV